MQRPYLKPIGGKPSKPDITTLGGGLNTTTNKAFIRDDQLALMYNVAIYDAPSIETRKGRRTLASYIDEDELGTYALNKTQGALAMIGVGKFLYTVEEKGSSNKFCLVKYRFKYNETVTRDVIAELPKAKTYYMCECRDSENTYIIISSPTQRYMYTIEDDSFIECDDEYAGIVVCHKQRLFIASGNHLYFSNLRQYNNFTINPSDVSNTAGEIQATWSRGDITAMVSYDNKLVIFFEDSRSLLYGDTPNQNLGNAFYMVDLTDDISCANDKALAVVSNYLYFVDRDMNVYRFNGATTQKISEPYNTGRYSTTASYGGIAGIEFDKNNLLNVRLAGYDDRIYIAASCYADNEKHSPPIVDDETQEVEELDPCNNILYVYDTRSRAWWAEEGDFSCLIAMQPSKYYIDGKDNSDTIFLASRYNGDILVMDKNRGANADMLFNTEDRAVEFKMISFKFETKTYLLGSVKSTKTLTRVWWQAKCKGLTRLYISTSWNDRNAWDIEAEDDEFDSLGMFRQIKTIAKDGWYDGEGLERQAFNIPRMLYQKINAFNFRVKGEGYSQFFMLEKEWRLK